MCRASGEQRKRIGPATSSAVAIRPTGMVAAIRSRPPSPKADQLISVSTQPGATQLTVTSGAHSTHSDFTKAIIAPLVAA